MIKYSTPINLLLGNEILGCPCANCSSVKSHLGSETDYPCINTIKNNSLPAISIMRYTNASSALAEGITEEGMPLIAYSSMRGIILFVHKNNKWEFFCSNSFRDLDAHFMDVDTSYSPAMCLRSLENELKDATSPEEDVAHLLVDAIKAQYLKALKDEVEYLEEYAY